MPRHAHLVVFGLFLFGPAYAQSSVNINFGPGTQQSLYSPVASIGSEQIQGTNASPITILGPSFLVSRTEAVPIPGTGGCPFNNNECNAAILGVSAQTPSTAAGNNMQITGLVGEGLVYSTNNNSEGVGVQGLARAVGSATTGLAGGFFEARYDSAATRTYYYTVGVETAVVNNTGRDAIYDHAGGNNYNGVITDCPGSNKCNSGYVTVNTGQQFISGFMTADNSVSGTAFDAEANSATAFKAGGTFSNQFLGTGVAIDGSGNATVLSLLVNQTAANNAVSTINAPSGKQAFSQYQSSGTTKWQEGNNSSNQFFIWDYSSGQGALTISSGTSMTSTYPVVLPHYTVASLPTCNGSLKYAMAAVSDFSGTPTYGGSVGTSGGSTVLPVFCNGTAWTTQ